MMTLQGLKHPLNTLRRIKQWAAKQWKMASCRMSGGHYWKPAQYYDEVPIDAYEFCSQCPARRITPGLLRIEEDHWWSEYSE